MSALGSNGNWVLAATKQLGLGCTSCVGDGVAWARPPEWRLKSTTYIGDREEGKRGRGAGRKVIVALAAEKSGRGIAGFAASPCRRLGRQLGGVRPGQRRTASVDPYGRMERLCASRRLATSTRSPRSERSRSRLCRHAARSSSRFIVEAMVDRHASRRRPASTPRLLVEFHQNLNQFSWDSRRPVTQLGTAKYLMTLLYCARRRVTPGWKRWVNSWRKSTLRRRSLQKAPIFAENLGGQILCRPCENSAALIGPTD